MGGQRTGPRPPLGNSSPGRRTVRTGQLTKTGPSDPTWLGVGASRDLSDCPIAHLGNGGEWISKSPSRRWGMLAPISQRNPDTEQSGTARRPT